METLSVGSVELAYETFGRGGDPPVILVMGLGAQLHYWHEGFCEELAGRGLCIVRFDNRDVGCSTHFAQDGPVDLSALSAEHPPPYTLHDMARDVAGLIEGLGLESAHLVGISLGGFIVQCAAIDHPERVRSLTSMSSTTGDTQVGQGRPEALAKLFEPPTARTREAVVSHTLDVSRVIGSPGFDLDEAWLSERTGRAFDRCYDPEGVVRQTAAILVAGDRTSGLRGLHMPALVVHGSEDPLVDVSGGRATAEAIPGAELLVVEGMGHDLPRAVWSRVADAIEATVRRAEAGH